MGYAYTPGLTVAASTVVRKVRRLPLPGSVLVEVGQTVAADDIVAETSLPGELKAVNVVGRLGITPEELPQVMLKPEGAPVSEGEPLARTKGAWGLFRSEIRAPIAGTIESVSRISGQVIIRGRPTPLRKTAYARGTVVDIQAGESATIEVHGTFIQGIFGIGGEASGPLALAVDSPDATLAAGHIHAEQAGQVIVGGSLVTAEAIRAAMRHGVRGIVSGGLDDADLRDLLGCELGVAITGEEKLGVIIVVTEGFGRISMAKRTFELLQQRAGRLASINGATQIRAGVIRPEVLIPLNEKPALIARDAPEDNVLRIGTLLRAIRAPYFGRIGTCTALPVEAVRLASEALVRVLEVEFEGGERAVLPRANVELIKQ